jgi:hypothetical protein
MDESVKRNIRKTYLKVPVDQLDSDTRPLTGQAFMLIDTIKSYVGFVLDYDLELIERQGVFTILECERPHPVHSMPIGETTLNFTYTPDRIDRLANGMVRIVDYKTGKDETTFTGMNALFNPGKDRRKAILQLFLYCHAYLYENPDVTKVMPVIYKLSSMQQSGVFKASRARGQAASQVVFSSQDADAQEFVGRMQDTVKLLREAPFKQAPEGSPCCDYCHYIDFCRRLASKDN